MLLIFVWSGFGDDVMGKILVRFLVVWFLLWCGVRKCSKRILMFVWWIYLIRKENDVVGKVKSSVWERLCEVWYLGYLFLWWCRVR